MRRRLAAVIGLLASAVALGGCVSIQSISGSQQDVVGKLRLTLTICASGFADGPGGSEDHPGCGVENAPFYGVDGGEYQLLFGIRVPDGTGTPETIAATPTPAPPASGTITARRHAGYEAALQAARPAPAGSRWVGYMSDPYAFDNGADGVPAQSAQVNVDLGLPPTVDGAPFVGPLNLRPVAGARLVDPVDYPADRPIDCGDDPTIANGPDLTICIDAPNAAQVDTNFGFPTRDFGVVAGNATASGGQTVALPFNVRGAGALPLGLSAGLTAATNLTGVTVAPSLGSVPLSNGSDTRVTVPVAIPADAGAGTYDVVLTGRLDNGQERRGVAQLTVRARPPEPDTGAGRDTTKPRLSAAKVRPKAFRAATRKKPKRGADVSYTLSEAASVRVVVERCSKYAKPKAKQGKLKAGKRGRCLRFATMPGARVRAGKAGANSFRFDGRVSGRSLKVGKYRLALAPTDVAGYRGTAVRVAFAIRK